MTANIHNILTQLLENEINSNTATKLYLEHQMSLPEPHRIISNPEDKVQEDLKHLRIYINDLQSAMVNLKNVITND